MHATLIYDADCPMCRAVVDWVNERKSDPDLRTLPCQSDERVRQFPDLSQDECLESVQFVLEDGRRYAGAESIPHLLLRVRGWRWLARILRLPGVAWVSPYVYRIVARNRHAISVLVHDKPRGCSDEDCSAE